MSLCTIYKDSDGRQYVTQGQLAACKDGAGSDGEVIVASLTAPEIILLRVQINAAATRAEGLAAVAHPPDFLEGSKRLLLTQPHDFCEAKRPGFRGKEEM